MPWKMRAPYPPTSTNGVPLPRRRSRAAKRFDARPIRPAAPNAIAASIALGEKPAHARRHSLPTAMSDTNSEG